MSDFPWSTIAIHRAYDDTLPYWSKYQEVADAVREFMRPARRILDAGCGSGIIAEMLAQDGADVEAVDLSAEMIAVAAERAARQPHRLHVKVLDATRLPHAAGTFSGIVSTNVVFAVTEPRAYLLELHRVLGTGGRLAICGPTPQAAQHVARLMQS